MILGLFVLSLASAVAAHADDFTFEPHGSIETTTLYYPEDVDPVVNTGLQSVYLKGAFKGGLGREIRFSFKPQLQLDPLNNTISERYWFEAPEGYVQFRPLENGSSLLSIQAGVNTFTWGVTDGYNPLDVVSAQRYKDPLHSEKLGAPSVDVHVEEPGGEVSLDGIWIPYQRRTILPGENSRWLPRETLSTQPGGGGVVLIPNQPNYYFIPEQQLDSALWNNFGLRLQAHLPSLDLQAVYFNGAAPVPAIGLFFTGTFVAVFPTPIVAANPDIGITPIYYRQETYGGSAVYSLGEFIFRFEGAFNRVISRNPALPGNSELFAGEVEHEFDIANQRITTILEGTVGLHQDPENSQLFNLPRMFDRAIILGARYAPSDPITISPYALFDVDYEGTILHLDVADSLTDTVKATIAGEYLEGPFSTPIGAYRRNSRVFLTLSYSL